MLNRKKVFGDCGIGGKWRGCYFRVNFCMPLMELNCLGRDVLLLWWTVAFIFGEDDRSFRTELVCLMWSGYMICA